MSYNRDKALSSNFLKKQKLNCEYCGKECHNLNSLKQHQCRCRFNSNRVELSPITKKGKYAWNKGLTKESDERIKKQIAKQSATKKGKSTHKQSEETKAKLREIAFANNLGGFNMHKISYVVDGKVVDSSYEKILAESLSKNNIRWERCKRFKYKDLSGKLHTYTPDFYLPDYNVYLDPKNDYLINNINPILGYKDIDKIKWVEEQNHVKIIILSKEELTWDYIKKHLLK